MTPSPGNSWRSCSGGMRAVPPPADGALRFSDADEINPYAREAMRWAVENDILNGYGDGRLGPQGQASRAQTAQLLKNFIENQEK